MGMKVLRKNISNVAYPDILNYVSEITSTIEGNSQFLVSVKKEVFNLYLL